MDLRPSDLIIAECMAKAGAVASLEERSGFELLSMARIVDALTEAGRHEDFYGDDPPDRSKQVDRLRSCVKRMAKAGVLGEGDASQGSGRGYYVFKENVSPSIAGTVELAAVEAPYSDLEVEEDEASATPPKKKKKGKGGRTTDEERMARPEWGRKLSLKVYKEWVSWSADFALRELAEGKAEENGIDLPDDFTGDDLCERWAAGGAAFNEKKLKKQLREEFPIAKAVKS